jgi:predicted Rossmann fold flavoprotein
MLKHKIIVIGAGPAGLMAAGQAAIAGAEVILLEKMNRPAKKLRITGKGRCNITNIAPAHDFISHFGRNGKFLYQAFSAFSNEDLIQFFNELGVKTVIERGGRVFPASGEADDIADALVEWNKKLGVAFKTSCKLGGLIIKSDKINGIKLIRKKSGTQSEITEEICVEGSAVIMATGGASYPATGSTGDGYKLAREVGHKIVNIRPALVPLNTAGNTAKYLQGLSLKNIRASIMINNKKKISEFGDMDFTDTGVSGPVILRMSGQCVDALIERKSATLVIDLKPALDHQKLNQRIMRDIKELPRKNIRSLLKGLLPVRLIDVCLESTSLNPDKPCNQITSRERKKLMLWLKEFTFDIIGYRPIEEAIITAGGIDVKEIDPRTMGSRIIKGLYFAGEILDINADTGGYNLQAAFSTGWLAGRSAALGSCESGF